MFVFCSVFKLICSQFSNLSSGEKLLETINKHLHCVLALKELYMRRSSNKGIQVIVCNAEVYVDPVEYILWQVLENVLSHLNVDVAFSIIAIRSITDLDPRRVERSVRVLVTRDQTDVLEPIHASHLTNLVEAALFHVGFIGHS